MTHGTLNIYIYDTQHLKHNGLTETVCYTTQKEAEEAISQINKGTE